MPHRLIRQGGAAGPAAPGARLDQGSHRFVLTDNSRAVVAGAQIELSVAFGGGAFLVSDGTGVEIRSHFVEAVTDQQGVVSLPPFVPGPVEGPNGITVQSRFATLEMVIPGSFENTQLRVISPLPADRDVVAGQDIDVRIVAEDTGNQNAPVRGLPIEVEITRGGAIFDAGGGTPGCYGIMITSDSGELTIPLSLARRAEAVNVLFVPLWERSVQQLELALNVRSPALLSYTQPILTTTPLWSLSEPIRPEVSNSQDATISPDDDLINGILIHAEESGRRGELIPPVSVFRRRVASFFNYPGATGPYQVRARLPDYPDTPSLTHPGTIEDPMVGGVPQTLTPGPLGRDFVHSYGGGNRDPNHLFGAQLIGAYHQYLGPQADTQGPMQVRVTVDPPVGARKLIEARFRFKVRTTPNNSSIDDPSNPDITAGTIAEPGSTIWGDEVTIALAGNPGQQDIGVLFRSNAQNRDHMIEMTADVTMEDEDANGNLRRWDANSTILLRAAVLQPRLYLSVDDGTDIVPLLEEGVRPVTLIERDGSQRSQSQNDAFFVELRCHDVGAQIECEVRTPRLARIQLERISTTPEYALYRSRPCFVSIDDLRGGGGAPTAPPGVEIFSAGPAAIIEARIVAAMPGNDDDNIYTTGRRPVSSFQMIETGDAKWSDRLVPPALHVEIPATSTWPADKTTAGHSVQISGWVQDSVAEITGAQLQYVEVDAIQVPLNSTSSVQTLGRPMGWRGTWSGFVPISAGVQLVRIAITNSLGAVTVRFFEVTLTQEANDFDATSGYTAKVRPAGNVAEHPVPYLIYLFSQGTSMGTSLTPPTSHGGEFRTLDAAPATSLVTSAGLTLQPRRTTALMYASEPIVTLREDLISSPQPLPPKVLKMALGGRIEWSSADLPHASGPIALTNRSIRRHQILSLLKKDDTGNWVSADQLHAGDIITVRGRSFPAQGGGSAKLEITDFGGVAAPGPDRSFDLFLTQGASADLELDSYMDPQFNFHSASEIALSPALDPDQLPPPLRVAGPGRLRLFEGALLHSDVPVFIRPARRAASPPVDQEPLRNAIDRLGALGTVVAGTGEVVLEDVDYRIGSRGLTSSFERTYRSANDYPGPLGHGWNASWDTFLWQETPDEFRLLRGDGRIIAFQRLATGGFETVDGMYATLEELPGYFRLRTSGGLLLTFLPSNPTGSAVFHLSSFEDRFGNRQTTRLGSHGRVTHVSDTLGRTFQFSFDPASGRLKSLSDYAGNETLYKTFGAGSPDGAKGNLEAVESPTAEHSVGGTPVRRKLGYTYFPASQNHRMKSIQDPEGAASALATLVEMTWHSDGHIATQRFGNGTYEFTPDSSTGSLLWKDRKGQSRTIEFHPPPANGFARLPSKTTVTARGETLINRFEYNAAGELTRHILPEGNALTFEYDDSAQNVLDRGNLLVSAREKGTSTQPNAVAVQGTYNPATGSGRRPTYQAKTALLHTFTYAPGLQMVATITDELSRTTTFTYSGGSVVSEARPTVTRGGPSHTPQILVYQYRYNAWGQILYAIDPAGVVTRHRYFPQDDPGGAADRTARAGDNEPGGYRAHTILDAPPPSGPPTVTPREPNLTARRPVNEFWQWDERGHQSKYFDGNGGVTTTNHNALGDLLQSEAPAGETTNYTFDINGRPESTIRQVTDLNLPAYLPASPSSLPQIDKVRFSRRGLLMESIIDDLGLALKTTWKYDKNDNVTFQNSPNANRAVNTRPNARIQYTYDEVDRLYTETQAAGSSNVLARVFDYDLNGNLVGDGTPGLTRNTFVYDCFDRLITRADRTGSEVQTHLDAVGNVVRILARGNPGADITQKETLQDQYHYHDEANRLVAVRERAFEVVPDGSGWREQNLGRGYRLSFYMFDTAGNQVKSGDRFGLVSELTYDGHGLPKSASDTLGSSGHFNYDPNGNVTEITQTDPTGTLTTTRQYDASGRPTAELSGTRVIQRLFYDSLGRPRFREDGVGNWTGIEYDAAGRRVAMTRSQHDSGRRLNEDGTTNFAYGSFRSTTQYDENSNVTKVIDFAGNTVSDLFYDDRNLVIRRLLPDDSFEIHGNTRDDNALLEAYLYTYLEDGSLDVVKDPTSLKIKHEYDFAGRIAVRLVLPGPVPSVGTTREEYKYDGLGRLIEASDDNGIAGRAARIKQRYTSLGGVTLSEQSDDLTSTTVTNQVIAGYSPQGQQTTLQYPAGSLIATQRNAYGLVEKVTNRTTGTTLAEYGWNGRHFSFRKSPNGLTLGFGYDADKEIFEARTYNGNDFLDDSNLVIGHRYAYDNAGRVVRDQDIGKDRITRIYHDSLDRLTATENGYLPGDPASVPDLVTQTDFDDAGNPIQTDTLKVSRRTPSGQLRGVRLFQADAIFNEANQLGHRDVVRDPIGGPPVASEEDYTYDPRGNLVSDGINSFAYDYKNRLVRMAGPSGTHYFHYDALDRRIRKNRVHYTYWMSDIIAESSEDPQVPWKKEYVFGARSGELVAYWTNFGGAARTYFPHENRSGRIEFMSDIQGDIAEIYTTDSEGLPTEVDKDGDPLPTPSTTGNRYRQHGQYFDREIGVFFIGSRVVYPRLGRFLQRDPGGALRSPHHMGNSYVYAGNNPLHFRDDHHGDDFTSHSVPAESSAAIAAAAAGKTVAAGLGMLALAVAVSFIPVVGPFMGIAILTLGAGMAMVARGNEMKEMGESPGYLSLFGLAYGDVLGISALIESYQGRRLGSRIALSDRERAAHLGIGLGSIATLFLGPRVFRWGVSKALRSRGQGHEPVEVELLAVHAEVKDAVGHLMIRMKYPGGRTYILDRISIPRILRKDPGQGWIRERWQWDVEVPFSRGDPVKAWGPGAFILMRARYVVSKRVADNALRNMKTLDRPLVEWSIRQPLARIQTCATLPGEVGLGLRAPLPPDTRLTILVNGLAQSGWGASAGANGVMRATRQSSDID